MRLEPRHCAACLVRIGYSSTEAAHVTGVSRNAAQRASAQFTDIQKRIPDRRLYCVDCLLRIGTGMNLAVRLSGVAKATVKRYKGRKGYGRSRRANLNLGKRLRTDDRAWQEQAWADEWRGVHYLGELRHWASHPSCSGYWRDVEVSRAKAALKSRARYRAMVAGSSEHLKRLLRARIYNAIVRQSKDSARSDRKAAPTSELIGCSIAELRAHLERNFQPGMTWANMGKWHIDHRKPCARFDLAEPQQQRECFHWSNLQPLWAWQNLSKSDRYEEAA